MHNSSLLKPINEVWDVPFPINSINQNFDFESEVWHTVFSMKLKIEYALKWFKNYRDLLK